MRARLAALTEVHEFYEFDAVDEMHFDGWLHEQIKRGREALGISEPAPRDRAAVSNARRDAARWRELLPHLEVVRRWANETDESWHLEFIDKLEVILTAGSAAPGVEALVDKTIAGRRSTDA